MANIKLNSLSPTQAKQFHLTTESISKESILMHKQLKPNHTGNSNTKRILSTYSNQMNDKIYNVIYINQNY